MINVQCPDCKKWVLLTIDEDGQKEECPKCGEWLTLHITATKTSEE